MTYWILPGIKNRDQIYSLYIGEEIDFVDMYAKFSGIAKERLLSRSKVAPIIYGRRIIVNAYIELTKLTLVQIGKRIGRTHASVINLRDNHYYDLKHDFMYKKNYENFIAYLRGEPATFDKPKYYNDAK